MDRHFPTIVLHRLPPLPLAIPVRSDFLAVGNLGTPPKWYTNGFPPLVSLKLSESTPDSEFVALLKPLVAKQDILDPAKGLKAPQREQIGQLLDRAFGTPAAPTVRVPDRAEIAELKLEELFGGGLPKDKTILQVLEETRSAAQAAGTELGLEPTALARGGIVYRRWCVNCHGVTGSGDGPNAIRMTSPPRDYRQGIFKFVTASPTALAT